ncbi:hypothetical protein B0H17DRAFT_1152490 [Mycena rosella]|uniref:Uncharacterized protein n=1 Tax=Mycena rosella TaxID=1033263 RepID=A0AAD7BDE8_MYCRO|nr:hypothetical protein B0H17DRAFT_1152490 [Mycena rosella]
MFPSDTERRTLTEKSMPSGAEVGRRVLASTQHISRLAPCALLELFPRTVWVSLMGAARVPMCERMLRGTTIRRPFRSEERARPQITAHVFALVFIPARPRGHAVSTALRVVSPGVKAHARGGQRESSSERVVAARALGNRRHPRESREGHPCGPLADPPARRESTYFPRDLLWSGSRIHTANANPRLALHHELRQTSSDAAPASPYASPAPDDRRDTFSRSYSVSPQATKAGMWILDNARKNSGALGENFDWMGIVGIARGSKRPVHVVRVLEKSEKMKPRVRFRARHCMPRAVPCVPVHVRQYTNPHPLPGNIRNKPTPTGTWRPDVLQHKAAVHEERAEGWELQALSTLLMPKELPVLPESSHTHINTHGLAVLGVHAGLRRSDPSVLIVWRVCEGTPMRSRSSTRRITRLAATMRVLYSGSI